MEAYYGKINNAYVSENTEKKPNVYFALISYISKIQVKWRISLQISKDYTTSSDKGSYYKSDKNVIYYC